MASSTKKQQLCPICQTPSTLICSQCKQVAYCSKEHQRLHWKQGHKVQCQDQYKADQLTLHKREFDRIVQTNRLDTPEKSEEIAHYLTTSSTPVTPPDFADKFGIKVEEAVVFLEWIKVGVNFKEQSLDVAKKSGFR